jgi:hypothetical protein
LDAEGVYNPVSPWKCDEVPDTGAKKCDRKEVFIFDVNGKMIDETTTL